MCLAVLVEGQATERACPSKGKIGLSSRPFLYKITKLLFEDITMSLKSNSYIGCNFSQAGNELGASSFLTRNEFLNCFPLYLVPSWERARSQTDYKYVLRYQLWPLDKKLRVIEQAKMYLKRHESEMEERLAQSKTFASRLRQAQLWLIRFVLVKFFDLYSQTRL